MGSLGRKLESLGQAVFDIGGAEPSKPGEDPFGAAPAWWLDWRGHPCVIVAGGPSAKDTPIGLAKDRAKFIAINNSWQLAPWADVLYACDWRWWERYYKRADFQGLKISQDASCLKRPTWGIRRIVSYRGCNKLRLGKFGEVGWAGNSGFHALNLAVTFGCRKILLVGYDMRLDLGLHWHGPHEHMNNPTAMNVERWRRNIDDAADVLDALGVEVINCSEVSALGNYPKVRFEDALEGL